MKIVNLLPGVALSVVIALLSCWLESLLPIHLIGSAVIAMFIGMFLNQYLCKISVFSSGLKFTSKKLLKFAIILLGLSLNITTILHVGKMSLTVMIFTLLTCFATKLQKEEALALVDDARAIAKKRVLARFMHKHSTDDMLDDCRDVILGIKTDAERRFPWRTLDHKLPF